MSKPTIQQILNAPYSDAEKEGAIRQFFPELASQFQTAPIEKTIGQVDQPGGTQNRFMVNPPSLDTLWGGVKDLGEGAWRGVKGIASMPGQFIESQAEPAYEALNAYRSGDYGTALKQGIRAATPLLPMAEGMGQDSGGRLVEATRLAKEGQGLAAVAKAGTAIPMVGPMAEVWGEDVASGHPLRAVGEAATFALLPGAARGAPEIAGAVRSGAAGAGAASLSAVRALPGLARKGILRAVLGKHGAIAAEAISDSLPKLADAFVETIKKREGVSGAQAEAIIAKIPRDEIAAVVESLPEFPKEAIVKAQWDYKRARLLKQGKDIGPWRGFADKPESPVQPYIKPQEPGSVEARLAPPVVPETVVPRSTMPSRPLEPAPEPPVVTSAPEGAGSLPPAVLEPPAPSVVAGRDPFKVPQDFRNLPPGGGNPSWKAAEAPKGGILAEYYNVSPDISRSNGAVGVHPELGLPMNAQGEVFVRNVHEFNQNPGTSPGGELVWRDPNRRYGTNKSVFEVAQMLEARGGPPTTISDIKTRMEDALAGKKPPHGGEPPPPSGPAPRPYQREPFVEGATLPGEESAMAYRARTAAERGDAPAKIAEKMAENKAKGADLAAALEAPEPTKPVPPTPYRPKITDTARDVNKALPSVNKAVLDRFKAMKVHALSKEAPEVFQGVKESIAKRDGISGAKAELKMRQMPQEELAREVQTVYHGSPHLFEKFKLSPETIGTGEGAQAYGHGLYVAESKQTGIDYMNSLSTTDTFVNGAKIGPKDPNFVAAVTVSKHGYPKALEMAQADATNKFLTSEGKSKAIETANQIRALQESGAKIEAKKAGYLYKAEIPKEHIDRFLDWDKPLSEQHPEVRAVMEEMILDPSTPLGSSVKHYTFTPEEMQKASGRLLYDMMAGTNVRNWPKSSTSLSKMGIPGIKYLDAGSRGAGSGTRNFVVFDDSIINTVERNGQPIKPPAEAVAKIKPSKSSIARADHAAKQAEKKANMAKRRKKEN